MLARETCRLPWTLWRNGRSVSPLPLFALPPIEEGAPRRTPAGAGPQRGWGASWPTLRGVDACRSYRSWIRTGGFRAAPEPHRFPPFCLHGALGCGDVIWLVQRVSNGYTPRMSKDSGLRIRVERELRNKFLELCRRQDRPAAQVLREFMRGYVAEHELSNDLGGVPPKRAARKRRSG